eukprot:gene29170-38234_t
MTGVTRSWRARNRDTKLANLYMSLVPKMIEAEKVLRGIIVDVAEKKNALRVQAKYLSVRLTSCLHHNKSLLDSSDNPVDDLREQINSLSNEAAMLKGMLAFNKEVLRIRKLESINREKQSFLRWGQKLPSNMKKGISESDLADDPDHTVIESRLDLTRQIRVKFLNYLQILLEKRSIEQFNLDNCEKSLHALASLVNRTGVTDAPASVDDGMAFDHSRCSDCSYGYSITCDCTNHMITLQKQGQDANDRLRELVVMREKMKKPLNYASKTVNYAIAYPICAKTEGAPVVYSHDGLCSAYNGIKAQFLAEVKALQTMNTDESKKQLASMYGKAVRMVFHDAVDLDLT